MADRVASHYGEHLELTGAIAEKLRSAGKNLNDLTTADLGVVADPLGLVARLLEVGLGLVELAAGRLELRCELALDPVATFGQRGLEVGRRLGGLRLHSGDQVSTQPWLQAAGRRAGLRAESHHTGAGRCRDRLPSRQRSCHPPRRRTVTTRLRGLLAGLIFQLP